MQRVLEGTMRTTVDINEQVLARAKRHADRTGQTLGAVVTAALGAYLAPRSARSAPPFELIVRGLPGGRFPGPDEIARAEAEEEIAALRIPGLGRRVSP
jgi:hypothetical protein